MGTAPWTWPTRDPYVTSPWDPKRVHPVLHVIKAHTGTDFRARNGDELLAAHAGTVVRSGYYATPGNYVRIDCGGGVWVGYSHLSKRLVAVGDRVSAGEVIGHAGLTGTATAAHLHFEVSVNGTKVDPVPFLAAHTGARLVSHVGEILGGSLPTPPTLTLPEDLMAIANRDELIDIIREAVHGMPIGNTGRKAGAVLQAVPMEFTRTVQAAVHSTPIGRTGKTLGQAMAAVFGLEAEPDVDVEALAAALAPQLTGPLVAALEAHGVGSAQDVAEAVVAELGKAITGGEG